MPPAKKLKPDKDQPKLCFRQSDHHQSSSVTVTEPTVTVSTKTATTPPRTFVPSWLKLYPWLNFDGERKLMFCTVCISANRNNSFTRGCSNFRTSSLADHSKTNDHQTAHIVPGLQQDRDQVHQKMFTAKEEAAVVLVKTVHWMVMENIPFTKFPSLMDTLTDLQVPHIKELHCSDHVHYDSRKSANEMLKSMSDAVEDDMINKLEKADFITLLADESTDRTNKLRLGLFVRIIGKDMIPSTHFITNIRIQNGTGETMSREIFEQLQIRGVKNMEKVLGLGTDGASAMVGQGKGLSGRLLRRNPHIVNVHCIAHRLALCTSQAAKHVPAMEIFVDTLTSLFKYFKYSATKCQTLENIQDVLESPKLKFREVHEVRWLSFFEALEAVFRNIDPLLAYFAKVEEAGIAKDPKAMGLKKKIATRKFIGLAHMLMDVIPVVSKLNLYFQRQEIDIALIKTNVDWCIRDLNSLKEGGKYMELFRTSITQDDGVTKYMGHLISSCPEQDITAAVSKFVDSLVDNITARFPDTSLLYAFTIMCMRPIPWVSDADLDDWGKEELKVLLDHYGEPQTHSWQEPPLEAGQPPRKFSTTSPPVIDKDASKEEWKMLKRNVKAQMFPRDKTSELWQLIAQYDTATPEKGEEFPNMKKLAQIALTLPIHTADVERGFSCQNQLCTNLRNRLTPENQDMMMRVQMEAPAKASGRSEFVERVVSKWTKNKTRKLFSAPAQSK